MALRGSYLHFVYRSMSARMCVLMASDKPVEFTQRALGVSLCWDVNRCHEHRSERPVLNQQKPEVRSAVLSNYLHVRAPCVVDEKEQIPPPLFFPMTLFDWCGRFEPVWLNCIIWCALMVSYVSVKQKTQRFLRSLWNLSHPLHVLRVLPAKSWWPGWWRVNSDSNSGSSILIVAFCQTVSPIFKSVCLSWVIKLAVKLMTKTKHDIQN